MQAGKPTIETRMYSMPWLRRARLDAGMTGKQVARRIGCALSTLYNWERGGRARVETVHALREIFRTPPRDRNALRTGKSEGK